MRYIRIHLIASLPVATLGVWRMCKKCDKKLFILYVFC